MEMSAPQTSPPGPATVDPALRSLLGDRIGFLLAKLHNRWAAESVEVLREARVGLTGLHFGALTIVAEGGPMSQQELGCSIGKDRTTIVAIVDDLEGEGLVERRRNPDDRRAYALEVTAKGHDWLMRARPALVEAEGRLLADLDPSEREVLAELLRRALFGADAEG